MQQRGIVRSCGHVGHNKADPDGQKIVGFVRTNPVWCEIFCNYQRLIPKRFQETPEEEIQGIEDQGAWRPGSLIIPRICNEWSKMSCFPSSTPGAPAVGK
ncbi:hypothetical protein TNCV_2683341 [Trichonephila clavipes]|nr:hypothetical protein TNCV_2683341 [Trichonephila clavipes]